MVAAPFALAYRRRQALLSARLAAQILQVWRDLARPDAIDTTWPALRSALAPIVTAARTESTTLARDFYLTTREQARRDAGLPPEPNFRTAPDPPLRAEQVLRTLDVTGPVAFKQAVAAGRTPQQAIDAAGVRMTGSAQHLALQGGRQVMKKTIEDDEYASGWARVTDGDPCAWCAMLASRGPVYKSARTAGRDHDARFTGGAGFAYHDHCACQAVPSYTQDEDFIGVAEQLYNDWLEQTKWKSGRDAVNAWRRWWEAEGRDRYRAPALPGSSGTPASS
ncbi:hypothetical protein [Streptomyces sp. C10-9-1]|uniref:VG15 protein n=1 Tax=Streptomyces sp. C10-9-1 TaxID=1859285 RepID=UPI003F4A15D1